MDDDEVTLNKVVVELVPMDPDFADQNVKEETIRTRIRRKLENGFSGREEGKNGYERTGIEHDDGFNYWLKQTMEEKANAKKFIVEQKILRELDKFQCFK